MKTREEKVFDLLDTTGLNWTVNKMPLITECGLTTNSNGLFRNDTDAHLGTVGQQYRAFQNSEMAELLIDATDGLGLEVSRGGELKGGKNVFMQIPLKDKAIGSDTVKRNISCLNSHDGSSSIAFGSTNRVVICQNTFHTVMKDKSMGKVRHSANSKQRLEAMVRDLRVAIGLDDKLMRQFEIMDTTPISEQLFKNVLNKAFGLKPTATKEDISTRKENQINDFTKVLASEIKSHGDTVWGLFNAMTYYTNHIEPKNSLEAENNVMVGAGYTKNLMTFEECMKWIEGNEKQSSLEYIING